MSDFWDGFLWGFSIILGASSILIDLRRKRKPKLQQFFLTFHGTIPVMLVAYKYEDDGTWQRYLDDRGIELLRIPSAWKGSNGKDSQ